MRLLALAFALSTPLLAPAQDFEPLRSSGELGPDFTRAASQRFRAKEDRGRTRGREARVEQSRRNDFALESAVALNRQHRSGQILTGDWVSRLVDSLGQRIVAASSLAGGEPVRFYVVASPGVNAFATPDRTVYVTMGLLARIESEAQLALVLSHELGHVEHDHSLEFYLDKADYADRQRALRPRDRDGDPFAVNRYSRANEVEADDYGFALYGELGYAGAEALSAFAILRDSHLPFGDHRLVAADLAALGLAPAEAHLLGELVEPDRGGDEASTGDDGEALSPAEVAERRAHRSTHPAVEDRLATATERLGGLGGARFLAWTPADLAAVRRQARYETTDYLLRDFANPDAAHAALALLADDPEPDVAFLRRTLVQAQVNQLALRRLYDAFAADLRERASGPRATASARRRYEELEPFPGASRGAGEAQRLYHLLGATPTDTLADLVLAQALALERDFPDLPSARALTDRAVEAVQAGGVRSFAAWASDVPGAAGLPAAMNLEARFRAARDHTDLQAWNEADAARIRETARRGPAEPIAEVTVLAPQYTYGTWSGGVDAEAIERTEVGEARQAERIERSMRAVGMRGAVLSDRLTGGGAEELNALRVGNEWLGQFYRLESLRLLPHNHDRLLALLDERGSAYLAHLTESDLRLTGFARGAMIYGDLLYFAVSPVDAAASLLSPRHIRRYGQLVVHPASRTIAFSRLGHTRTRQGGLQRAATSYALFDNLRRGSGRAAGVLGRRHLAEVGADVRILRFGAYEAADNSPGIRAAYRYAATPGLSVGAAVRLAGYRIPPDDYSNAGGLAVTSRQYSAEVEWHGRRARGPAAPLGLFYGVGVGMSSVSSDAPPAEVEDSRGAFHEIPDGAAAFASLSVGYRYVLAERYAVAPFARVNLGRHGTRLGASSRYLPQAEGLQTGVRVGLLW